MNYDRLLQLGGIDREVPPIPGYITKEQLQGEIDGINTLIPDEASDENQLADKAYVNNKVSTDSATFRGTYNLVNDLSLTTSATREQVAAALGTAISTADNNDFCYVEVPTDDTRPTEISHTDRYKFNGTAWAFEYQLNSFTAIQWDAINSGITSALVTAFGAKAEVGTAQDPKTANTVYGAKAYADDAVSRVIQGFVDLGLPSGTLWASKNLGAETPEDNGYYFSWGNIEGHKPEGTTFSYDWGTSNSGPYASTIGAELTTDIPSDNDAALRYMGGNCKMPTTEQFTELVNNDYVTREFVTNYRGTDVNGLLITSKTNGNKLFFPAAGNGSSTSLLGDGVYGFYWSRNIVSGGTSAYDFFFSNNGSISPSHNDLGRNWGFSIRAIM